MYVCKSCDKRFDKPKTVIGSGDYYLMCPFCSSENYRELDPQDLTFLERIREHRKKDLEPRIYAIEKKLGIVK